MNSNWIEKLREYFFSHRAQDLDVNAAIELKQQNIPKKLYKYRAVNDYSISNLEDDTVWCTHAASFNDPYDSSLCFDFNQNVINDAFTESLSSQTDFSGDKPLKKDDIKNLVKSGNPLKSLIELVANDTDTSIEPDMAEKLYDVLTSFLSDQIVEMNERFNSAMKQGYKICSFSERVNSMLMWSHYSENHTGFVMEYDFTELGVSDVRARCVWPVIYDDNLFDASAFINEQKTSGAFNNLFGIIASIHKAKDWSYEEEWRLIVPLSPSDPPMNYPVPTPKAVYLGSKISDFNKDRIIKIAAKKKLDVYSMKLAHNKFQMVPEKISMNLESNYNKSIQPIDLTPL